MNSSARCRTPPSPSTDSQITGKSPRTMRNTVLASFVLLLAVAHTGCHSDDVLPPAHAAWLNVREFGALGTGTVDDGPAIQRALDKASESGGTVYLPLGIYLLDDALD